jgi:hypothetical protein
MITVKKCLKIYGTFQVVYDDMKTVSFSGDLKANFRCDFGISGTRSYTNDVEQEAWEFAND